MGQFNLWTYVSITDIAEELLIEIFHTTWHPILFLCSSNYPFNFLLLICINSLQSVFLPDCLYIFQKPFNYLLILLFTYYINTFDLCNPPPCLDLAKMNFSCKVCSNFLNCFPLLIHSAHLYNGEQPKKISLEMLYNSRLYGSENKVPIQKHLKHVGLFQYRYEKLNLERLSSSQKLFGCTVFIKYKEKLGRIHAKSKTCQLEQVMTVFLFNNLEFLLFSLLCWTLYSIYLYDNPHYRMKSTFCCQIWALGIVVDSGW